MITCKFGGSSVGDGRRIQDVARIVAATNGRYGVGPVVVSAMSGVTDKLVEAATRAAAGEGNLFPATAEALWAQHQEAAEICLADAERRAQALAAIRRHLDTLVSLCRSIYVLGECTPRALDLVSGLGERMSIHLVAGALQEIGCPAEAVEATSCVVTSDRFGAAEPLWEDTRRCTRERLLPLLAKGITPVVTGFIGATKAGVPTTLGRGGSDYSGAIVGSALDAKEIWIWTDVNGVMTADPRIVPEARTLPEISYLEAAELSYFGAKVLHPKTVRPAIERAIPVRIKNTFEPEHPGTLIVSQPKPSTHAVKAITAIRNLSMITVEGRGMMGVPGIAAKVFTAVARAQVSVLMISQSSSEQNICLVIPQEATARALSALQANLAPELGEHDIERVDALSPVAIVAIVGAGMRGTPGVSGRAFTALGRAGINIIAIAQGSSEYNISFCVDQDRMAEAVRLIHAEFDLGTPNGHS